MPWPSRNASANSVTRSANEDENLAKTLALVKSDRSDLEKFEKLGLGGGDDDGVDPFLKMFEDTSIDVQTGELLGRYIAEERDSGRVLRACYQQLRDAADDGDGDGESEALRLSALSRRAEDVLASLNGLRERVAELRS